MHNKLVKTSTPAITAGLRVFLYLTAAVCGATILIVEILGAKMLAPFFGTSHFVWTAQIGVTLVSLALGYYIGGKIADRWQKPGIIYLSMLLAAVYLCLTVPLCRPVAYAFLKFKLAVGSLLASMFLFFIPLCLLAMVAPLIVRLLTSSLNIVGGQVGRLSAISTIGSVVGTLLIGYIMIPNFPNSMTMYFTAILLMLFCIVYYFKWHRNNKTTIGVSTFVIGGLIIGFGGIKAENSLQYAGFEELERRNSNFGLMQVLQSTNQARRYYLTDYLTQNIYDPLSKRSLAMFTYMLHGLARVYTPGIERALCIGLGVGIVPMQFANESVKVDVVEINPAVVPLAQRHFNFDPAKMNIYICDGRYYLNWCTNRYDTIILDAFLGDSSPSHLMTKEAFESMRRLLEPEGTLVINSFGDLEPGRNFFTASLEKTLKAVFKSVKIHTAHTGNIFFVASDRAPLTFVRQPDLSSVHPSVQFVVENAFETIVETDPAYGQVLTDDFNPVEYYDAENRERLRRFLAEYMKPS